jgi:hypothetical protein
MRARGRLDPAGSSARPSLPMAPQWSQGEPVQDQVTPFHPDG